MLRLLGCFFLLLTTSLFATDKFILFSPPKCGTHLIAKTLERMLNRTAHMQLCDLGSTKEAVALAKAEFKDNGFVVAHNWTPKMLRALTKKGFKIVFILRDPRDQVISMQDWMHEGQWQWLNVARMQNPNAQLEELITGLIYGWKCYEGCIGARYWNILMYLPTHAYTARFENLVGEKGGGSKENQVLELLTLAQFLNHPFSQEEAEAVAHEIYGETTTFRFGKIGRWKKRFTSRHKKLYKERYGQKLIKLGYETTTNW